MIVIIGPTETGIAAAAICTANENAPNIVILEDSIPTDGSFTKTLPIELYHLEELKIFIEDKELPKPKITYYGINKHFKNSKNKFDKRKIGRRFCKNAFSQRKKRNSPNFKTNNS